jgi:hypothetical protein
MITTRDKITFEECPVCSAKHIFPLDVVRKSGQVVLAPDTEDQMAVSRAKVVFTCPTKVKEFEKVVPVYHRPYEYVDSVSAKPAKEEK